MREGERIHESHRDEFLSCSDGLANMSKRVANNHKKSRNLIQVSQAG